MAVGKDDPDFPPSGVKPLSEAQRAAVIRLMESMGSIDPNCPTCQRQFYTANDPRDVFAPRHRASVRCRSGQRPHCTCDTCF